MANAKETEDNCAQAPENDSCGDKKLVRSSGFLVHAISFRQGNLSEVAGKDQPVNQAKKDGEGPGEEESKGKMERLALVGWSAFLWMVCALWSHDACGAIRSVIREPLSHRDRP